MEFYYFFVYVLQICLLFVVSSSSSSSSSSHLFISGDVLKEQRYAARNLLQAKRKCPLNFEFANYTILTSNCKGPSYPAKQCCAALGEFACPYAKYINDPSYDCSAIMLVYIHQRGYPQGVFSSECREDIPCPADSPSSSAASDASAAADALLVVPHCHIIVFTLLFVWIYFIKYN